MEIKITEEQLLEVAERYGLIAEKSDNSGFYLGDKKVTSEELFERLFLDNNSEESVQIKFNKFKVNKSQSK